MKWFVQLRHMGNNPKISISTEDLHFVENPVVSNQELNELFAVAWQEHAPRDFQPVLRRSLVYLCAYLEGQLIGFINLAWDGGFHAFVLDVTVHPNYQRRGIGVELVRRAAKTATQRGVQCLHVDYESHLDSFYKRCGFQPTNAGLIRVGRS